MSSCRVSCSVGRVGPGHGRKKAPRRPARWVQSCGQGERTQKDPARVGIGEPAPDARVEAYAGFVASSICVSSSWASRRGLRARERRTTSRSPGSCGPAKRDRPSGVNQPLRDERRYCRPLSCAGLNETSVCRPVERRTERF